MSVSIDDEIRANRDRFQVQTTNKNHSFKWILTITVGVFIGVTASTLSIRAMDNAFLRYELNELNKKMALDQVKMKKRQQEQAKINAARLQHQKIENEKRQAGYRQAMETCKFWRDQYRKEQTNSNRYQRDQSCNFVSKFQ